MKKSPGVSRGFHVASLDGRSDRVVHVELRSCQMSNKNQWVKYGSEPPSQPLSVPVGNLMVWQMHLWCYWYNP